MGRKSRTLCRHLVNIQFTSNIHKKKQSLTDAQHKSCSSKFHKIHNKATLPEFLSLLLRDSGTSVFPQYRCFHLNFAKSLATTLFRTSLDDCFRTKLHGKKNSQFQNNLQYADIGTKISWNKTKRKKKYSNIFISLRIYHSLTEFFIW